MRTRCYPRSSSTSGRWSDNTRQMRTSVKGRICRPRLRRGKLRRMSSDGGRAGRRVDEVEDVRSAAGFSVLRDVVQLRRRRSVQVLERQRGRAAEQEPLQRVRPAHDAVVDVEVLGAQAVHVGRQAPGLEAGRQSADRSPSCTSPISSSPVEADRRQPEDAEVDECEVLATGGDQQVAAAGSDHHQRGEEGERPLGWGSLPHESRCPALCQISTLRSHEPRVPSTRRRAPSARRV